MASDLRPRPVPIPAAGPGQIPRDQLPGDGRPPFRTGQVHMSDFTRRNLQAVGWKEGDPIPGDLGERLQELQREVNAEQAAASLQDSELAKGWKPVEPKFVSIENLPPEKQKEIAQYLSEYKRQVAQDTMQQQQMDEIDQSIPPEIQGEQRRLMREGMIAGEAAAAARQARQSGVVSTVIDDRVPQQKPTNVADQIERARQQQAAFETKQVQPPPTPIAAVDELPAAGTAHANCQRCSWPLSVPFEMKPTDEDKQGFMAAILGLGRFEKKYELLGGNLEVYFRSLTTDETTMVQSQLGAMVRAGESIGDVEFWANLMEFRLVLSLSKLKIGDNVIYTAKPIADWEKEHPPAETDKVLPTPIPRLRDFLYEKCVTQEPLRRILGQTHQEFQRLVEALEFMTNDSDFWKGIELRG